MISDQIGTSNTSINRRNVERGDTIQTYEGDFNYTYEIYDSWIMDQSGVSNSIYFLNEDVMQWEVCVIWDPTMKCSAMPTQVLISS
jgi:hypothetical protein